MAADFGCGTGGWAIPLAKRLGSGRVYAIDVQEEVLSALKTKVEMEKINNIKVVKADLEQSLGSSIQNNLLDLILMTNLLFQVKDKKGILGEAKRILRSGGRLVLVDWKPDSPFGPQDNRLSLSEAKEMAQALGLTAEKELNVGAYHWGLILAKN